MCMQYRFLNQMKKKDLEEILKCCDENSELKHRVLDRLEYIRKIDEKEYDFSSDRMSDDFSLYSDECREIMKTITVSKFPFLVATLFGAKVNKMNALPQQLSEYFGSMTLAELEDVLKLDTVTRNYEGTYNTLNYIKNYICGCLATNSDLVVEDLFSDYGRKIEIVTENLDDIANMICEVKGGTKLQFSVGNRGLMRTANGNYNGIHPYQKRIIEAVAFGNRLSELENGNYEGVKRLLYLPKGTKTKK